jgi:hypothetical protein
MRTSLDHEEYKHRYRQWDRYRYRHGHGRRLGARGISLIEGLLSLSLLMAPATQFAGAIAGLLDRVQINAAVSELRAVIQAARLQATQRPHCI